MSKLKTFITATLSEARTKVAGDLSAEELISLINYSISGSGVYSFTEKFAGSHVELLLNKDGDFYSKSKSSRSAGVDWQSPAGLSKKVSGAMISLSQPASSRRFAFEFIDSVRRPDYINYLIGEQPVAVEYSGELSKEEANSINNSQSEIRIISSEDIQRDDFILSSEQISKLEELKLELESGNLKRKEEKSLAKEISKIIGSSVSSSMLGGPIEGLMVKSDSGSFKIPNPQYANIQRLQAPLYAMFSGRGGVSKRDIKARLISPAASDRLIQDIYDYANSVNELPSGFRSFLSPEEAEEIISLLDDSLSGDSNAGKLTYAKLNKRINDKSSWVNT